MYCHPPPDVDAQEFNKENFDISRYIKDRAKFEKFTQQTEKIKQENKTKVYLINQLINQGKKKKKRKYEKFDIILEYVIKIIENYNYKY